MAAIPPGTFTPPVPVSAPAVRQRRTADVRFARSRTSPGRGGPRGTELLRSIALDRNSDDSGDWFNRIDRTGQESTFGSGLPREVDNGDHGDDLAPLPADPANRPGASDIAAAEASALDLLRAREQVGLLRLGSAELIEEKVSFPDSGTDATPGVIVMLIDDLVGDDVDPRSADSVRPFATDVRVRAHFAYMCGERTQGCEDVPTSGWPCDARVGLASTGAGRKDQTMRYMMFVVTSLEPDAEPDESDVDLWVDPLDASGKRVIGDVLAPVSDSTVVRVRGGQVLTSRGPFAETAEVIAGFDILEVESLDEAIQIASRHPMARNGQLELRPFMVWPGDEPGEDAAGEGAADATEVAAEA